MPFWPLNLAHFIILTSYIFDMSFWSLNLDKRKTFDFYPHIFLCGADEMVDWTAD